MTRPIATTKTPKKTKTIKIPVEHSQRMGVKDKTNNNNNAQNNNNNFNTCGVVSYVAGKEWLATTITTTTTKNKNRNQNNKIHAEQCHNNNNNNTN